MPPAAQVYLDNNILRPLLSNKTSQDAIRSSIKRALEDSGTLPEPFELIVTPFSIIEFLGINYSAIPFPKLPQFEPASTIPERIQLTKEIALEHFTKVPKIQPRSLVEALRSQVEHVAPHPISQRLVDLIISRLDDPDFYVRLVEGLAFDFIQCTEPLSFYLESDRELSKDEFRSTVEHMIIGSTLDAKAQGRYISLPRALKSFVSRNGRTNEIVKAYMKTHDDLVDCELIDLGLFGVPGSHLPIQAFTTDKAHLLITRTRSVCQLYLQYAEVVKDDSPGLAIPPLRPGILFCVSESSKEPFQIDIRDVVALGPGS